MNSRLRSLLAASAAVFVSTALSFAGSGSVGGDVTPINHLTESFKSDLTIGTSTPGNDNSGTDVTIFEGQIDNNDENGWRLTVESANEGKLLRGTGGAGREIAYTNIKLVRTSAASTLGTGLIDPHNTTRNIATGADAGDIAGTTVFNTGESVDEPGTATDATAGYTFKLVISWSNDPSLLSGSYSDTLTVSLDNDS